MAGLRPNVGEPNGTMKTSSHRYTAGIQAVAVCLLVIFISVTTLADLFHNHEGMGKRPDCPACLWHQISQEADDGPTAAELITSSPIVTNETPQLRDGLHPVTCDISTGIPIRAPPAL